ncbi:universal stress protein [Thermodesulfobacteriota bacterium]
MYKTILVPLDGSKEAERILRHVENLAQCFRSRVIFVQIVRLPRISGVEEYSMELHRREMEQRFKEAESYLKSLKGEFREKGIHARTHVVHGPVVNTIINIAEREAVDLIAMTSHGRTGLARVFYGSVAAGLLHLADRSLLIIRSRAD